MRSMRMKAIVITTACATSVALSAQTPTIRIRAARVVDGTGKEKGLALNTAMIKKAVATPGLNRLRTQRETVRRRKSGGRR